MNRIILETIIEEKSIGKRSNLPVKGCSRYAFQYPRKRDTLSDESDFERAWQAKFSDCLGEIVAEEIRKEIMSGSDALSSDSTSHEVIEWTKRAMQRLDSLVDKGKRKKIMTGCACQYPKPSLRPMRKVYEATKGLDLVHQMLQEQFELFFQNTLKLNSELIEKIVNDKTLKIPLGMSFRDSRHCGNFAPSGAGFV